MIGRMAREKPLPGVAVQDDDKQLVACVEYALRGMGKKVFVALCEMLMMPKWEPYDM